MFLSTSTIRSLLACLVLVAMVTMLPPFATLAMAQASGMAGVGETETVTIRATVKAVDMKTRTVTLLGPQGETKTMKVGAQVQNLAQVKPGDIVVARFYDSVAYVLSPPGTKVPEDTLAAAAARAAPGGIPAGGVAEKVVGHRAGGRREPDGAHDLAGQSRGWRDPHHRRQGSAVPTDDELDQGRRHHHRSTSPRPWSPPWNRQSRANSEWWALSRSPL